MDRILFGDNQFFGIDHLSEEKARAKAMRFANDQAIIEILDAVYDLGIHTFMCTTHERMKSICDYYRANQSRFADFKFFPCMPYAHKYANAVTELGMVGALKYFTKGHVLSTLTTGSMAMIGRDMVPLMKILVDAEMRMFEGLNTPVIFLQNIVTDLLLGMGAHDFFLSFAVHVKEKYNAEPGFITMNMPRLLSVLNNLGIDNPIICSSINKIGFRMSGGTQIYEDTIEAGAFRPVAMQILAAGAVSPSEAVDYVCQQQRIQSIVFGASTLSHIKHTKELIDRYEN